MEFNLSKNLKYIFNLFKNYYCKFHGNYKYNFYHYIYIIYQFTQKSIFYKDISINFFISFRN